MAARHCRQGFSLIEIIVVLVIIGVALAFAIPSFINSIELTNARIAKNNLLSIAAAQQKFNEDYSAAGGSTYCFSTGTNPTGLSASCGDTIQDLNLNLKLSMNGNDPFSYVCFLAAPYVCQASDTAGTELTLNPNTTPIVSCTTGSICTALGND